MRTEQPAETAMTASGRVNSRVVCKIGMQKRRPWSVLMRPRASSELTEVAATSQ